MVVFEAKKLTILNKAGVKIFSDFSFKVQKGEIWILNGPNGIGKSSFYESLIGIQEIKKGKILLNNEEISSLIPPERVRKGLKYTPQTNALFSQATVLENLKMISELLEKKDQRNSKIQKAIELFSLKAIENKKAGALSGGQKRRVELSKIIIGKNDLIIMDEPFAAIDEKTTEKVSKVLLKLKEEGKSFIITDHNLSATEKIADKVIDLDGKTAVIREANKD